MKNPNIYLSNNDYQVLTMLLHGLPGDNDTIKKLSGELARAIVLESVDEMGAVGLNDEVRLLDVSKGIEEVYTPVLPTRADPDNNKISVLVPMGAALLGFREGDEFEWPTPGGMRRLKVLEVRKASQIKPLAPV